MFLRRWLAHVNISAALMLLAVICVAAGVAFYSYGLALITAGSLVWVDVFVENLIAKIKREK